MNKEIEIKIQINDCMLYKIRNHLVKCAIHSDQRQQVDHYLDDQKKSFFFVSLQGDKDSYNFLRIRETGKETILCLKRSHKNPKTRAPIFAEEYETLVFGVKETLDFMTALGYIVVAVVKKARTAFLIDDFEVSIDKVEGLGTFLEIELKRPVESVIDGRTLIYDWLKSVGITEFKLHKQGYVHMIMNPQFDFSEMITL